MNAPAIHRPNVFHHRDQCYDTRHLFRLIAQASTDCRPSVPSRCKAIGAYAQIDFLLADICLQFWEWPAYRHLEGQFPVNAAARVEAVTVLFKANGPLTQY